MPKSNTAGSASTITAAKVNEQFVITKCDYFSAVQLWPIRSKLNPSRWLSNFEENEKEHAVQLLQAFIYFSRHLMEQLFYSAFQRLSLLIVRPHVSLANTKNDWSDFLQRSIITRVTGEKPSDTDSSFYFSRMARQVLKLSEGQILGPTATLAELEKSTSPRPVIFVDDFVGSGQQFVTTWERRSKTASSKSMSFELMAGRKGANHSFIYCPLVCTQYGKDIIHQKCPEVSIHPAHLLPPQYSALAADSILWPESLLGSAAAFIESASRRAGIPENKWRGFHDLGLALAFEHSVPDATLPLFYWNHNGWHPLVERS